jgi:hypothetical protein
MKKIFRFLTVVCVLQAACSDKDGGATPDGSTGDVVLSMMDAGDSTTDRGGMDTNVDGTTDVVVDTGGDGRVMCADNRVPCNGVCCAMGESCGGRFCCAERALCGGVCCGPGRRCEGGSCALDCGANARCGTGAMSMCCATGQVCYLGACATPGMACTDLVRCAEGQYCEPTIMRCLPRPTSTEMCEYRPPVGRFVPQLKWSWVADPDVVPANNQVMMQPVVANLTDDNRDGRIDHNDIPDVVFATFASSNYWSEGVLRAVSGADGRRLWPVESPEYRTTPGASVAIAELDASSPGPELVTCSPSNASTREAGHAMILRADGRLLRRVMNVPCGFSAPAIGDIDNDGTPDIVIRNLAFHADGTLLPGFAMVTPITTATGSVDFASLADMNNDGTLEIVLGNRVLRNNGTVLWERTDVPEGYNAVADLDGDRRPEVVVVAGSVHAVYALRADGTTLWGPVEINQFATPSGATGGGPPTIADFNGDGTADVATAGGYNYLVLNGNNGSILWFTPSRDTSSRVTGSSVFDFEGDGRAEVVYNDELVTRVYRGSNGDVIWSTCNTSGTLWEYPVIVDLDRDDSADIVVMSNNYASGSLMCADGTPPGTGIRVYSDPDRNWVRTRSIWNQHTYHVTNIDDDGNVPRRETANWTVRGLNNFRQNVQPEGLFDAPDLVPIDLGAEVAGCPAVMGIRVRVLNRGRAGAPAGVPVVFLRGTGMTRTVIGRAVTTRRLLPGESEVLLVRYEIPVTDRGMTLPISVVVNDATMMPLASLHECNSTNNSLGPQDLVCFVPG